MMGPGASGFTDQDARLSVWKLLSSTCHVSQQTSWTAPCMIGE